MGSELDAQLKTIMDRLTAPRSVFARGTVSRGGSDLVVFSHAPETLPNLFARTCADHADKEFLIDGEVRLTFAQVHQLARRAAVGLVDCHGVKRGDRVGIVGRNSANWIIAYMAVLIAGGCATLLNGWWVSSELADGIDLAECSLVLADPERSERLAGTGCGW